MSQTANSQPTIEFDKGRGGLSLIWAEDDQCYLNGDLLRRACRCASCRAAQIQDKFHPGTGIKVTDVKLFGVAGLQLFFSDSHSRGVYPWGYLRELSQTGGGSVR